MMQANVTGDRQAIRERQTSTVECMGMAEAFRPREGRRQGKGKKRFSGRNQRKEKKTHEKDQPEDVKDTVLFSQLNECRSRTGSLPKPNIQPAEGLLRKRKSWTAEPRLQNILSEEEDVRLCFVHKYTVWIEREALYEHQGEVERNWK
jgi:hypothetical protein